MIDINPQYESIFDPHNMDEDCKKIAYLMESVWVSIKEALAAGLYERAGSMYLQLLKAMSIHFVKDEHWCYFDDLYSPELVLKGIFADIKKYNICEEQQIILDIGHGEIMDSECYQEYGYPSYL